MATASRHPPNFYLEAVRQPKIPLPLEGERLGEGVVIKHLHLHLNPWSPSAPPEAGKPLPQGSGSYRAGTKEWFNVRPGCGYMLSNRQEIHQGLGSTLQTPGARRKAVSSSGMDSENEKVTKFMSADDFRIWVVKKKQPKLIS